MLNLAAIFDVDDPPLVVDRLPRSPAELPVDWWVVWDERSAIREFEGGMHRELAESEAFAEVVRMMAEKKTQRGLDGHPE